jgi:ribosome maturation factor RimP
MAAAGLRDRLIALIEPLVEQLGYELVDVEWAGGSSGGVVRVYIDQPDAALGHIGIEDCERTSRQVSALLDELDPVPGAYSLEVSSPGFDRVLRLPRHFGRFVGQRVRVELGVPRDGRRRYTGELTRVDADGVELEVDQLPVRIGFDEIEKARLVG